MTVRLWARTAEEAELISPAAIPDLSLRSVAGLIPFLTDDPILRCLGCERLLTAREYDHPAHRCHPVIWPAETDHGITLDGDSLLVAYTAAAVRLTILAAAALITAAAAYGLAVAVYSFAEWLDR